MSNNEYPLVNIYLDNGSFLKEVKLYIVRFGNEYLTEEQIEEKIVHNLYESFNFISGNFSGSFNIDMIKDIEFLNK